MTIDVVFKAIDRVAEPLRNINNTINKVSGSVDRLANSLAKPANKMEQLGRAMIGVNQSIEAFDRMGQAAEEITTPYREFEQSMAELSSITGIVGDELDKLGAVARKTGADSGLGAKGAAQAFALLASQIDVSKIGINGLIGLQKETITLAQAAGVTMDESANAMAGTINQFGLQATEASRVINVLAAGSKYGAASIPDLAQSFKVVGAAANAAGLTIEDTAGVIEVLSKNNLKGAEAGTAMRNIMLKMQTTLGVDFSKTSMAEALENLKPKMKDAAYISKVFGMESMAAAQFLIANSASVKEMTDRVTSTKVATEQAAINTDTWNFSLAVQAARMDEMLMSFTESNKEIFSLIQTGSKYMQLITSFAPLFQVLKLGIAGAWSSISWLTKGVEALGGKSRLAAAGIWVKNAAVSAGQAIMSAYNFITNTTTWTMLRQSVATKASALWTRICSAAQVVASTIASLWAKRTVLLTAVQTGLSTALKFLRTTMLTGVIPALTGVIASTWAWTAALLANPITWIVIGVGALVAAIVVCWNQFAGFRAFIYTMWDAIKGFGEAIIGWVIAPFKAAGAIVEGLAKAVAEFFSGDFSGSIDAVTAGAKGAAAAFTDPVNKAVETARAIGGNYDKNLATENEKDAKAKANKKAKSAVTTPSGVPDLNIPDLGDLAMLSGAPAGAPDITGLTIPPGAPATDPLAGAMTPPMGAGTMRGAPGATNINITFNPTVNISGDMSAKSREDFLSLLRSYGSDIARLVNEELRKTERGNYAVFTAR